MLPIDKYVKIVYESSPIGDSHIVLYLTTFDLEKYEQDQKLEESRCTKRVVLNNEIAPTYNELYYSDDNGVSNMLRIRQQNNYAYIDHLEEYCNALIKQYYEPHVKEAVDIIEAYKDKITPINFNATKKVKDVVHSDKVECDVVCGDVVHCNEVHCKEIRGNMVHCKVYKE